MQQSDTGYILIGQNGVPEGIVSKSDLTSTVSPYLRPEFAKWRRPLDDATLQIRVKWIMTKLNRTISSQTPLVDIVKNMCQFGLHALPVIDEQGGKVQGLIAEINIFKAILKLMGQDLSTPEKVHQEQPASEQPTSEQPVSEQPASEQAASEQPVSEQPATEQAASEQPAPEQPTSEQPASEQLASEQPASEQPATEQAASEQPASEQPASEQPASEQAASEQPTSEQPTSEQPAVSKSTQPATETI
jgi:hypothetical protein